LLELKVCNPLVRYHTCDVIRSGKSVLVRIPERVGFVGYPFFGLAALQPDILTLQSLMEEVRILAEWPLSPASDQTMVW